MGPGGIATIIASASLLLIAGAIAYAVFRVARLIDEVQKTVRSVNRITTSAEKATEKINQALETLVDKNTNILKLLTGAASSFIGRKRSSTKDHD
jgi:predicted PurR-regulated permease PerM